MLAKSVDIEIIAQDSEKACKKTFSLIDKLKTTNFTRIHQSILKADISDIDLLPSSGYGYTDWGRDKIEKVFAEVFAGEDSMVRPQIATGTQAIYLAIMGAILCRRAGKSRKFLILTGDPYPTLQPTMKYINTLELKVIKENLFKKPLEKILFENREVDFIYLQRSRGYSSRPSLSIIDLEKISQKIKKIYSNHPLIIIDNCYTEFVADKEPNHVGADIVAGSLLKNPGGGLNYTGGYLVGKKEIINAAAEVLFGPGLSKEVGPVVNKKEILQGLYLSPLIVSEALKGMTFGSYFFKMLGFQVSPKPEETIKDIILSIEFASREDLMKALKVVQEAGPLNIKATPEGEIIPGYLQKVVMAGGTFVPGSSIELSADAILTPPWVLCLQGGLYYEHYRQTCINIAKKVLL